MRLGVWRGAYDGLILSFKKCPSFSSWLSLAVNQRVFPFGWSSRRRRLHSRSALGRRQPSQRVGKRRRRILLRRRSSSRHRRRLAFEALLGRSRHQWPQVVAVVVVVVCFACCCVLLLLFVVAAAVVVSSSSILIIRFTIKLIYKDTFLSMVNINLSNIHIFVPTEWRRPSCITPLANPHPPSLSTRDSSLHPPAMRSAPFPSIPN